MRKRLPMMIWVSVSLIRELIPCSSDVVEEKCISASDGIKCISSPITTLHNHHIGTADVPIPLVLILIILP